MRWMMSQMSPSTPMAIRLPMRRSARTMAIGTRQGRIDSAQEEYGGEAHLFERLVENARLERRDVSRDVGEFRHVHPDCRGGGRPRKGDVRVKEKCRSLDSRPLRFAQCSVARDDLRF